MNSISRDKLLGYMKENRVIIVMDGINNDDVEKSNEELIQTFKRYNIDTNKFITPIRYKVSKTTCNILYIEKIKNKLNSEEKKTLSNINGIYELSLYLRRTEEAKRKRKELESLSNELALVINKEINKYGIITSVVHRGSAIKVEDTKGTYIWIRLMVNDNKLNVQFSTVQLREDLRRKGIFTELFNKVKVLNYVSDIDILGVSSNAMLNWVTKNGLEHIVKNEYSLDYKFRVCI